MLELIVLDRDFSVLGVIDGFETLIWRRKYTACGDFELHCSDAYFQSLRDGAYLYRSDRPELGLLQETVFSRSETGAKKAVAKGNFAEALLSDRVFGTVYDYSGKAEAVLRQMVNDLAIAPAGRKIGHLALGASGGLGEEITGQVTGDVLSEKLWDICAEQALSLRITLDYDTDALLFTVWQGLDRTQEQSVNAWAVFSDDFENVLSSEYRVDPSARKTFAYVAGEGEGAERVVEEVALEGADVRRELYVDARDISKTQEDGTALSDADYRALLRQRGLEALSEYEAVDAASCQIDGGGNLVYGRDYDLGDLCTYVDHEHGILTEARITELTETYENGAAEVSAVLGEGTMTIRQYIDREVRRA